MMLKLYGAILIFLGCGGFGFSMAAFHCRAVHELQSFSMTLEHLKSELEYRLTPLSLLCRGASDYAGGNVGSVFLDFSMELDAQCRADVFLCMQQAVLKNKNLSHEVRTLFLDLGKNLGAFDLSGQIRGIEEIQRLCTGQLQEKQSGKEERIRNYKTLGLCAGAALAVLLV